MNTVIFTDYGRQRNKEKKSEKLTGRKVCELFNAIACS